MAHSFYSFFFLLWWLAGASAWAQTAGTLDPFDAGPVYGAGQIRSSAVQPDGKIVIAGIFDQAGGALHANIARVKVDGTIDSGFAAGTDGPVLAVALQADGQVLIAGTFLHVNGVAQAGLARLRADGSYDPSFIPPPNPGSDDDLVDLQAYALAVQSDGRIVAAGNFSDYSSPLVRLMPDGSLDASFHTNWYGQFGTLRLLPGGRIFAGTNLHDMYDGAIILDATGRVVSAREAGTAVTGTAVAADGGVIYAAEASSSDSHSILVRLGPNGAPSFPPTVLSPLARITALALQADGRLLVGGDNLLGVGDPTATSIARLNTDGTLDRSVPVMNGSISSLVVQSDQTISVFGSFNAIDRTVCYGVAKLLDDLSVQPGFAPSTRSPGARVRQVAVQGDGRILVAGPFVNIGGQPHHNLARLNLDGTVDAGFNADLAGAVSALLVQEDGRIVIAGTFGAVHSAACSNLARIGIDGSFDPSFTPVVDGGVNCLASQPNGKLLAGGYFSQVNGAPAARVARINPDGSLDAFPVAADGWVDTMAVDGAGRIVLGGAFTMVNGSARGGLARVSAAGQVETTFDPMPARSWLNAVLLQRDGRILIAGQFSLPVLGDDYNLARLREDGSPDPSFVQPSSAVSGSIPRTLALEADGRIVVGFDVDFYRHGPSPLGLLVTGQDDPAFNLASRLSVGSMALLADGRIVLAGDFDNVNGAARAGLAVFTNEAVAQTLSADTSSIAWQRRGAAAEITRASFDYSSDGVAWSSLGWGSRVAGGWQLTGIALPAGPGYVRARGLAISGARAGSAGQVEQIQAITLAPRLVVEQPAGTPLASGGPTAPFAPVSPGGSDRRDFSVRNAGGAPLAGLRLTVDGPNAAEFTLSTAALPVLAAGESGTFSVTYAPTGSGLRQAAVHLAGDLSAGEPFSLPLQGSDNSVPALQLTGGARVAIAAGGTFSDPGAVAQDAEDGSLTPVVTGTVDTTRPGTYLLTYTATDQAGTAVSLQRSVEVVDLTLSALGPYLTVTTPALLGAAVAVHYAPLPATDRNGQPLTALFSRPDGSLFPVGRTLVGVTITGSQGGTTFTNFAVEVTPPAGERELAAAWGSNSLGQLGRGLTVSKSDFPALVPDIGTALGGEDVMALAAGADFSLALCRDGSLVAWGSNAYGQLGNAQAPSGGPAAVPVRTAGTVLEGKTVIAIAAGASHSVALCSDGTLAAWGRGHVGQLGNGSTVAINPAPVAVPTAGTPLEGRLVVDIVAGGDHTLALCQDGTVAAWGDNSTGGLGDGSSVPYASSPVAVATRPGALAQRPVVALAAGKQFSLALCADGSLAIWGDSASLNATTPVNAPVLVPVSGTALAGERVIAIAAGSQMALALCADGRIAAWGSGYSGQIGNGNFGSQSAPQAVSVAGTPLAGRAVVALSAGEAHSLALCSDGTLAAWGQDGSGQLGDQTSDYYVSNLPGTVGPPTRILARGSLANHTLAAVGGVPRLRLKHLISAPSQLDHLTPVTFGYVSVGRSRDDEFTASNAGFADLAGVSATIDGANAADFVITAVPDPILAPGALTQFNLRFTPAARGSRSATLHLRSNDAALGTLDLPLAGTGNFAPSIVLNGSASVTLEAGAKFIDPGATGSDPEDGPLKPYLTGDPTTGTAGVHQLIYTVWDSAGASASVTRTLNVFDDIPPIIDAAPDLDLPTGSSSGAAFPGGYGTTGHDNSDAVFFSFSRDTSAINLSLGRHVIGVTARDRTGNSVFRNFVANVYPYDDLSVRTWGDSLSGRSTDGSGLTGVTGLAAGAFTDLAVLQQKTVAVWGTADPALGQGAATLTEAVAVAAGHAHALALRADGTVFGWGSDLYGQAAVPSGLQDVVAIAAGARHSLALKRDGSVVAWGDDSSGQVRGASGLSRIVGIAAGDSFSVALRNDGTVLAWGSDAAGQVAGAAGRGGIVEIAAGDAHVVALKGDGTVLAWGADEAGQVSGASGRSGMIAIAASRAFSLALRSTGTCDAWGDDRLGQVTGASGWTNLWAIAAGGDHAVALASSGVLLDAVRKDDAVAGRVNLTGTVPMTSSFTTTARFQYATTPVFGPDTVSVPAQVTGQSAAATVSGLALHQAYYFRLVAQDDYDGNGLSNVVALTLSNQPPLAREVIVETPNGSGFEVDALAGATDSDHDALRISDVFNAVGGDAQANATADRVIFQPLADFVGQGSFDYTVSDGRGGFASAHVTLHDTAAPRITMPASYTIIAGAAAGAEVTYPLIAAADDVTSAPVVTCAPLTGSLLPVGLNQVTVTATDLSGNVAHGTFTVTVLPPPPGTTVIAAKNGLIGDVDLPATAAWRTFGAPGFGAGAPLFSATYALTARSPISSGIFTPNGLVLATGDLAPGVSKAKFAAFAEPVGGPTGFAFTATTLPAVGQGLWSNLFSADGAPALIAGAGLHPAALPGISYRTIPAVAVGASGDLFWLSTLAGPKVTAANALALFGRSSAAGGAKLLLRAGQESGGHTVVSFIALQSASSVHGYGAGRSDGGFVTPVLLTLEHGLRAVAVVGPDHDLEIKALLGAVTVPSLSAAKWQSFSIPAAGSSGLIAFRATILSGKTALNGLFAEAPGAPLRKVVLQGDPAASLPGLTITNTSDPILNAAGDVAFVAILAGPHVTSLNNEALYLWPAGASQPTLIARKGVAAPDAGGLSLSAITGFALAERPGSVVYMGTLRSGATGLWAVNSAGTIQRLALTGTTVAGHSLRTIGAFQNVLGSARQARTAAAPQHVIYRATFSDLSQAVIEVAVP